MNNPDRYAVEPVLRQKLVKIFVPPPPLKWPNGSFWAPVDPPKLGLGAVSERMKLLLSISEHSVINIVVGYSLWPVNESKY